MEKINVFGYGRQANKIIEMLSDKVEIASVIDSDDSKNGMIAPNNMRVLSFYEGERFLKEYFTVVMAMGSNYGQISAQLKSIGLREGENFTNHENYITTKLGNDKLYILKTDIYVTGKCNLRCKNCAAFVPYGKKGEDENIEEIKSTIDLFFGKCDFVFSMDIFGGEPMLYSHLSELLEYLCLEHRKKIGYLGIITNGHIKPDEHFMAFMRNHEIGVSISDYSDTLPIAEKMDDICSTIDRHGIKYMRNRAMVWRELGFPNKNRMRPVNDVVKHREYCGQTCHTLYREKIFYCAANVGACQRGLYPLMNEDYRDLRKCSKEEIKRFVLGETDENYHGFCSVCNGYGEDNPNVIQAAIQMVN